MTEVVGAVEVVALRGSVSSFDAITGNSVVIVGEQAHEFHSTSFWPGNPTRFPTANEAVDVLFERQGEDVSLLGVRALGMCEVIARDRHA